MAMDTHHQLSALDQHVAPGLRLWMLIALVSGVLLIMVVLVCCFMRIRIPRTKRQIDLIAAKRKMRNKNSKSSHADERSQAIVMNSMRPKTPKTSASSNTNQQDDRLLVYKGSKQHTEV
uniref:Transmembrane inner ear n=1 Tax=Heterorhabditis bacteriophora TaxID=37862 RepID=A0A1I7X292_HETBA